MYITPQLTVHTLLAFPSFDEHNGTLVVFACAHNVVDGAANSNGDEHDRRPVERCGVDLGALRPEAPEKGVQRV
jgi:hypothetical protein